jgi:L-ribulose-5-phosphate 3-epimerase UlaE
MPAQTVRFGLYEHEPSTPETLARFREGLAWATDAASAAEVMLGVEIMAMPLMGSITCRIGGNMMSVHPSPRDRAAGPAGNEARL